MLIRLEYGDQRLYETTSADLAGELVIGRSHECQWRIPAEATWVGARHVSLTPEGRRLLLRDLGSANGTYHGRRRITSGELQPGDVFHLGQCRLSVEREQGEKRPVAAPSLLVQTGNMKGQRFPLVTSPFTIGSGHDASLTIPDPIVSREHAEIIVDSEGVFRVRDLGSTNGTTVDGRRLREGDEIPLGHGCRLYVAYYGLVFHDGRRRRSPHLHVVLATAAALFVVLATAATMRIFFPSPRRLLARARAHAQAGAFDKAEASLNRAEATRRGARQTQDLTTLRSKLSRWIETAQLVDDAVPPLQDGDWPVAIERLDALIERDDEAWNWGPTGEHARQRTRLVHALLKAFLAARDAGRDDPAIVGGARADRTSALRQAAADWRGRDPGAATRLLADALQTLTTLDALGGTAGPFAFLNRLTEQPPAFEEVLSALKVLKAGPNPPNAERADRFLPIVEALERSARQYGHAVRLLADMQLESVDADAIVLPLVPDCAVDPRLAAARTWIQLRVQTLSDCLGLLERITALSGRPDGSVPVLEAWQDKRKLQLALDCDALRSPPPRTDRQAPSSEYDHYVGIENFYEFCFVDLSGHMQLSPLESPFRTVTSASRDLYRALDDFQAFVEQRPDADWRRDALAERAADYADKLRKRKEFIAGMAASAPTMQPRAGLIAAGMAILLSDTPDTLEIESQSAREWAAARFRTATISLRELNGEYDQAPASRRADIEKQVLATGLPGDPVVKRLWH